MIEDVILQISPNPSGQPNKIYPPQSILFYIKSIQINSTKHELWLMLS